MKNILAFGDSLTWGYDAATQTRHPFEARWPSVLADGLKMPVQMLAEGLNGRTTVFDDYSAASERNGAKMLPSVLATHEPLDLVIMMLGTNDMRPHICGNAAGSAAGIGRLISIVKTFPYKANHKVPQILVVSPPLTERGGDRFANHVMQGAVPLSRQYADAYRLVAEENDVSFFDAAKHVSPDPMDGFHLDQENTKKLGKALIPAVSDILAS
ncbi:SGNH/GDSL hydrolase family protein [Maritalea mediterranea]|uniref:SGNH/GDSL hydrolase family protein n=1 Tax=Maritalea mediterranea TaxID=2909667 RepID=A0ABS9E6M2_9HYPH|nr:SGNH/GDSL hydrolase family protein [Maritalea mediterranea]MCF4098524.1 SGNH/GDSL hydrolase family protein [Maritalea mediterranea]